MRFKLSTLIAAIAATAMVGSAAAGITVYSNDFERKSQYREIDKLATGKSCGRSYRKSGSMGVKANRGRAHCTFSTPVHGDRARPDHEIKVKTGLTKATPKSIAGDGYVGLRLRASKSKGYEFRLYPASQKWKLLRYPSGSGFPLTGTDRGAVNKFPRKNTIALRIIGDKLSAKINKDRVVRNFKDTNPLGEVDGVDTAIVFGTDAKTRKDTVGFFDNLKVGVAGS